MPVIVLLALSDSGAPAYDHEHAAALAALGVPAFACTPDAFPDLLAVALTRGDVAAWAAAQAAAGGAGTAQLADPAMAPSTVRGSHP